MTGQHQPNCHSHQMLLVGSLVVRGKAQNSLQHSRVKTPKQGTTNKVLQLLLAPQLSETKRTACGVGGMALSCVLVFLLYLKMVKVANSNGVVISQLISGKEK
jgi:hypothetical protein